MMMMEAMSELSLQSRQLILVPERGPKAVRREERKLTSKNVSSGLVKGSGRLPDRIRLIALITDQTVGNASRNESVPGKSPAREWGGGREGQLIRVRGGITKERTVHLPVVDIVHGNL